MTLLTAKRRNTTVAQNLHQSFFVRSTPRALNGAQYIAVSHDGTVLYGLRIRIELSIVQLPEQAPEVITTVVEKTICKYHVASGDTKTFELDDYVDPLLLARVIEFYAISDDLVVIMCYETDKYLFNQIVIHLEHVKGWAQEVAVRRMTVSRVIGPPLVNLSFLHKGRVLLCGARSSVDGVNERLTLSIAADPMKSSEEKDDDLSLLMEEFNKYLTSRQPDIGGKSLISLFILSLDDEKISILLSEIDSEDHQSEPVFATGVIGLIDRKTNTFSVEKVENSVISTGEPLKVTSIANMKTKNGSVWMSFSVTDIESLKTVYWKLKLLYVRIMLRLMIFGFHGSLYLWKFDNGFTFYWLTRLLVFLHGPTMIPVYSPQKKFCLCYLDIKRRRFFRYDHYARVLKNKRDPNETDFAINFDIDSSGGAVVLDHPTDEEANSQMAISYYQNPSKPQSLAKLATYSAYRNFPAFEKSSLLRRLTAMRCGWIVLIALLFVRIQSTDLREAANQSANIVTKILGAFQGSMNLTQLFSSFDIPSCLRQCMPAVDNVGELLNAAKKPETMKAMCQDLTEASKCATAAGCDKIFVGAISNTFQFVCMNNINEVSAQINCIQENAGDLHQECEAECAVQADLIDKASKNNANQMFNMEKLCNSTTCIGNCYEKNLHKYCEIGDDNILDTIFSQFDDLREQSNLLGFHKNENLKNKTGIAKLFEMVIPEKCSNEKMKINIPKKISLPDKPKSVGTPAEIKKEIPNQKVAKNVKNEDNALLATSGNISSAAVIFNKKVHTLECQLIDSYGYPQKTPEFETLYKILHEHFNRNAPPTTPKAPNVSSDAENTRSCREASSDKPQSKNSGSTFMIFSVLWIISANNL